MYKNVNKAFDYRPGIDDPPIYRFGYYAQKMKSDLENKTMPVNQKLSREAANRTI